MYNRRVLFAVALLIAVSLVTPLRAAQYDIAATYTWTHLKTDESSVYDFHSPGVSFGISSGTKIGFLGRGTLLFPRGLYQDGEHFSFHEYYTSGVGGDFLLGVAYNHLISEKLSFVSGGGVHSSVLYLGGPSYESFYSFTIGAGVEAKLLYQVHPKFSIGGFVNTAYDFGDFIHDNNALAYGYFLTAGILFSVKTDREN